MKSWKSISISKMFIIAFLIYFFFIFSGVANPADGGDDKEGINPDIEKEMVMVRDCFKQKKYLETINLCNEAIAKYGDEAVEAAAVLNLSIRHVVDNGLAKAEEYYRKGNYINSIVMTYAAIFFSIKNGHPPPQKSYDILDKATEAYLKTLPGSI